MKTLCLLILLGGTQLAFAQNNLTGDAAALFKKAEASRYFSTVAGLKPEVLSTTDGQSFLTVWRAKGGASAPKRWIVSLHGTHGFATDDLVIWSPHLKGRDVGLLSVQWWLGGDNPRDSYYAPAQVYREVDLALQKLGVRPGTVMFHGFSRGSANAYAIVALDAGRGRKYFALNVASSGGVGLDYPPTRAIVAGIFGDHPLKGTRWITCAGGRDPQPERDGIPGMRRAAAWLREQGATVVQSVEDPNFGHGALVLNPKNAKRVLDLFLAEKP